ncbi:hypothetical protein IKG12_03245 [Candidatus Saccharibacteria bacterium]|nr:hypothetical protein [Candidatus Saccharibacteria bacterium]MBR3233845.1 hypothetical protein [Candidatus Saccharibacteria bacterium]
MFEIESKKPEEITIITKKRTVTINVAQFTVDAGLEIGPIHGPGEYEIGDIAIRGIATPVSGSSADDIADGEADGKGPALSGKTIYDVEVGGVHIGIIGDIEQGLDDLGVADILCTSSVRAIREIEPKMVIAMGNIDGMVTELKLSARTEKKLKIKNADALPVSLEVVALN